MSGGDYERELKGILQADAQVLHRVTKTCTEYQELQYFKIQRKPFIVIRAAGSFGVDLVALRGDVSFPIEVKSSVSRTIRFSRNERVKEQAERMQDECARAGLVPIYAFRLKRVRGDTWRMFALPQEKNVQGKLRIINDRMPKVDTTKAGNYVLRWDDGMTLADFIDYVC